MPPDHGIQPLAKIFPAIKSLQTCFVSADLLCLQKHKTTLSSKTEAGSSHEVLTCKCTTQSWHMLQGQLMLKTCSWKIEKLFVVCPKKEKTWKHLALKVSMDTTCIIIYSSAWCCWPQSTKDRKETSLIWLLPHSHVKIGIDLLPILLTFLWLQPEENNNVLYDAIVLNATQKFLLLRWTDFFRM